MTLPARAPYCVKCQSFTTLDKGGTECEECGSRDIEIRDVPNVPSASCRPPEAPMPSAPVPVTVERGANLFQKLRDSLGQ